MIGLFRSYHFHFISSSHAYYICTLDTVLMLITVLVISTRIYLSLHDTWHSPEYLLGSFWLPWTYMFRFWCLDWSGALHRRSSLSFGAGRLVPAPSVPESFCKLGDILLSPWAPFCCTNCNSYFCTLLWYNVHASVYHARHATCLCTLLLACTDA